MLPAYGVLRVQIVYQIGAHSRGPPPRALSPRTRKWGGRENRRVAGRTTSYRIPAGPTVYPARLVSSSFLASDADAELLLASDAFMGSVKRFRGYEEEDRFSAVAGRSVSITQAAAILQYQV